MPLHRRSTCRSDSLSQEIENIGIEDGSVTKAKVADDLKEQITGLVSVTTVQKSVTIQANSYVNVSDSATRAGHVLAGIVGVDFPQVANVWGVSKWMVSGSYYNVGIKNFDSNARTDTVTVRLLWVRSW